MIRVINLTKKYDKIIFENFSYDFAEGATTLLKAPSGKGKTTLLNILMGVDKRYSGTVLGVKKIAAAFQDDRLFNEMTLLRNIKFVCSKVCEEDLNAKLRALKMPGVLRTKAGELSGGMRRRAGVLRAIAAGGDAYIFDEPFAGLDSETKRAVAEFIAAETKNKTVIVASHDADFYYDYALEL
jgi:NitT/TauT family transport system ATP-binding protein